MRIDGRRISSHKDLKNVVSFRLISPRESVLIALAQRLANCGIVFASQFQTQPIVFDAFAPQVIALRIRLRPNRFIANNRIVFLDTEVELLIEQTACISHAVNDTLPINIENGKRDAQVFLVDGVINFFAAGFEAINIRLQENQPIRIKGIDIAIHDLDGQSIVQGNWLIMKARKKLCRQTCCLNLLRQRL
ncbi:hypothetical protein D3C80_765620 [compost metagenome]